MSKYIKIFYFIDYFFKLTLKNKFLIIISVIYWLNKHKNKLYKWKFTAKTATKASSSGSSHYDVTNHMTLQTRQEKTRVKFNWLQLLTWLDLYDVIRRSGCDDMENFHLYKRSACFHTLDQKFVTSNKVSKLLWIK